MTSAAVVDVFEDPRVAHCTAVINDTTYKYLLALPDSGHYTETVFLIHGWPDLSMGWRYQIPMLLQLGLRVVCPDLMGFGGTSAPQDLEYYSHKRASDDIKELARQLGTSKIILGGHVFSVCTPYHAPTKNLVTLENVVERAPNFGYQIHLAGPEVEAGVDSKEKIRQFLNGMFGARGPSREVIFSPENGIILQNLDKIGKSKLLSDREMDYYVQQYGRNGLRGTLNWYRTREINWQEEKGLETSRIEVPVLFIQANMDNVLLPSMSAGMEKHIPKLTRAEVDASHWALWQTPAAVNDILRKWLEGTVLGEKSRL